jgi:hypothetical protein
MNHLKVDFKKSLKIQGVYVIIRRQGCTFAAQVTVSRNTLKEKNCRKKKNYTL